ncbi:hypothetical protein [Salinigranum marinum]|nr:hypothetical protein [Salinigranum marinum]
MGPSEEDTTRIDVADTDYWARRRQATVRGGIEEADATDATGIGWSRPP